MLKLNNDLTIRISTGASRKATTWKEKSTTLSALYQRISEPKRSAESYAQYKAMTKAQQDALKDVGGYVCGVFKDGRRKIVNLETRSIVTLDADNVRKDINKLAESLQAQDFGYCYHTTRKHTAGSARVRILVPLSREVTADEYNAVARRIAEKIDPSMNIYDGTTFDVSRLMYWPSVCADGEYLFDYKDAPAADPDALLAEYIDWTDVSLYATVPSEEKLITAKIERAKKQQNPLEKSGFIGAFCRTYDIDAVIENFLDEKYAPGATPTRYSYSDGSTANGAIVYDSTFLYSHHNTDPASGQLLNAFDLVRVHNFGYLDENAKPDTPVTRLPSYAAMMKFASEDEKTKATYMAEKRAQADSDFADIAQDDDGSAWLNKLQLTEKGKIKQSTYNALLLMLNDPKLKGKMRHNKFFDTFECIGPMPWKGRDYITDPNEVNMWCDNDDAGLRMYIEQTLGFRSKGVIEDALNQAMYAQAYNPLQDYLNGLEWDGVPRLDTMYIDFFGDEDNIYTREVARKSMCGLVSRALIPGCKFDNMTVISGPQGLGKSTFLEKLAGQYYVEIGTDWNNPKVVAELFQRAWIVEVAEFAGFSRSDTNSVKSIISLTKDTFRPAYAARAVDHPRHCGFFATTNDHEYLKDKTGNRRYWPINCGRPKKKIFGDLTQDYINQLWAEAVAMFRAGESLLLSEEAQKILAIRHGEHIERDDFEGVIVDYLEKEIPDDWDTMDAFSREVYMKDGISAEGDVLVKRHKICVAELACECLGFPKTALNRTLSRRIANILDSLPDWERRATLNFGGLYGRQRGWVYVGNAS